MNLKKKHTHTHTYKYTKIRKQPPLKSGGFNAVDMNKIESCAACQKTVYFNERVGAGKDVNSIFFF
jgi:hypothetical protein